MTCDGRAQLLPHSEKHTVRSRPGADPEPGPLAGPGTSGRRLSRTLSEALMGKCVMPVQCQIGSKREHGNEQFGWTAGWRRRVACAPWPWPNYTSAARNGVGGVYTPGVPHPMQCAAFCPKAEGLAAGQVQGRPRSQPPTAKKRQKSHAG